MATTIAVTGTSDLDVARQTAKEMALGLGFNERASSEMAIAARELASNLLKHAQGGALTLATITDGGRVGVRFVSHDRGPGIADVEQAMVDGFSTTGSLGYGLGAVNRLMDQFDITSQRGTAAGTTITCTRWLRSDAPAVSPCPLEFGAATRAYPSMTVNGDAFVIKRWQTSALVAVIDGIGHGPEAHHAAHAAKYYVETHFDQPLEAIFLGVDRTCRATRGVVMALGRFDFAADGVRFSFASVGNIEARLCQGSAREHLLARRGILGGNAPSPWVTHQRWQSGQALVLHSDGVTQRWRWENFADLDRQPATTIAQRLLRALAKTNDDATIVVVRDMARER